MRFSSLLSFFVIALLPTTAFGQSFVATLGGDDYDYAGDMIIAPDGDLILVGAIQESSPLPQDATIHLLVEDVPGPHRGFVARYSPDGTTLRWLALFPAETFVPSRVAADDNVIALAGDPLQSMSNHLPAVASNYSRGAIVVLSADGTEVLGARGGPPNTPHGIRTNSSGQHSGYQAGITGLSIYEGLVYATGSTSGTGQGAYVVRYDTETLEGVDFSARPDAGRLWAIDLHNNADDLLEALTWRYDPDHEGAEFHQGDCRINLAGNRRGGQVLVTDFEGGTIFASFDIQYDFNCTNQWFPAFDAGIAAWTLDGELKWATNALDRMVSEPDQGPRAMAWDPFRNRLVVALWQHGSNVARLPGELIGDTGNISIGWVGLFDPADGSVEHAWYQHAVREDSNGAWDDQGQITGWPRNSGNTIHGLAIDAESRVIVAASGGNRMFTTADALQDWPEGLWGGHATITVLSPDLQNVEYATVLRREAIDEEGGSVAIRAAVNGHGLFVFGQTDAAAFLRIHPEQTPWQSAAGEGQNLFFARIAPEDLPFVPGSGDSDPGDQTDADFGDVDADVDSGDGSRRQHSDAGCACTATSGGPGSMFFLALFALGAMWMRRPFARQ